MKRKLLFLFCLVLAVPLIPVAAQQTATVKGIVTDAQTGEPLIGVSVVVPGTTHGIATDVDGSYELNNVPEDGSLEFSYLGYETRTVAVGGRTVIDVALDMASDQIEELVVVGYAVQRKRDVLGAVNKVEGAELAQIPVPSAQLALQGRVPGRSGRLGQRCSGCRCVGACTRRGFDKLQQRAALHYRRHPDRGRSQYRVAQRYRGHHRTEGCGFDVHIRFAGQQRYRHHHHQEGTGGSGDRIVQCGGGRADPRLSYPDGEYGRLYLHL